MYSGNVPVRPNSARERGSKHLMIDLNKGRATELTKAESPGTVQGGAIAHMASALQVLHEARENQLAQKEIDSRRLYRSESDRIQEQQVVEQHDGLLVSGVIHHGGGSGRLVHEREPPSLTTRLPSVRPPLMLSRDVTPNSIPRLDKDWLPDEKEVRDNRRN